MLQTLRSNPDIREDVLNQVLADIERAATQLFAMTGKIGQYLRENEWLMSIKQRTSIPGGACQFDLPSYHYWLNLDADARRADVESWLAPFQPIYDGISIVLRLLRDSGKSSKQVAMQGVFQQMMSGRVAQLVRIRLSRDIACIPEISANKYALNVRFTAHSIRERPKVAESDIEFELTFCNI